MAIRRSIRWFVPHYLNVIDGWTNEWTDRKSPCSTGLHPLQGRCPKKGKALTELPTPLRRERGLSEVGGEKAEKQLGISHREKQKTQDDGIPPHAIREKVLSTAIIIDLKYWGSQYLATAL